MWAFSSPLLLPGRCSRMVAPFGPWKRASGREATRHRGWFVGSAGAGNRWSRPSARLSQQRSRQRLWCSGTLVHCRSSVRSPTCLWCLRSVRWRFRSAPSGACLMPRRLAEGLSSSGSPSGPRPSGSGSRSRPIRCSLCRSSGVVRRRLAVSAGAARGGSPGLFLRSRRADLLLVGCTLALLANDLPPA